MGDFMKSSSYIKKIYKQRWLYLFAVPGFIFFLIFAYVPMFGVIMSFQDFDPVLGFFRSPFIGFNNFKIIFAMPDFKMALKNTFIISLLKLAIGFPAGIIFALLINEVRNKLFKRTVQTITYLPYFISWVIAAGIWYKLLSVDNGVFNEFLRSIHIIKDNVYFFGEQKYFLPLIVISDLWKNLGFASIIYLASLSGIDIQLYEAASIDGAGRFKKIWHISLPGLKNMIVLLLILNSSSLVYAGFDQLYNMGNINVRNVGEILDTLIYRNLMTAGMYAYPIGAAMGLFQAALGLVLFLVANTISRLLNEESVL